MTVTKVDDLFDGITTQCGSAQFYGYHDPNVHVLLILVFGIFALVFLYYLIRRRPRSEYGLMFLWCVCAYPCACLVLTQYSGSRFVCFATLFGHQLRVYRHYGVHCGHHTLIIYCLQLARSMDAHCRQLL